MARLELFSKKRNRPLTFELGSVISIGPTTESDKKVCWKIMIQIGNNLLLGKKFDQDNFSVDIDSQKSDINDTDRNTHSHKMKESEMSNVRTFETAKEAKDAATKACQGCTMNLMLTGIQVVPAKPSGFQANIFVDQDLSSISDEDAALLTEFNVASTRAGKPETCKGSTNSKPAKEKAPAAPRAPRSENGPVSVIRGIFEANRTKSRKEILALCVEAGVKATTASTIYQTLKRNAEAAEAAAEAKVQAAKAAETEQQALSEGTEDQVETDSADRQEVETAA